MGSRNQFVDISTKTCLLGNSIPHRFSLWVFLKTAMLVQIVLFTLLALLRMCFQFGFVGSWVVCSIVSGPVFSKQHTFGAGRLESESLNGPPRSSQNLCPKLWELVSRVLRTLPLLEKIRKHLCLWHIVRFWELWSRVLRTWVWGSENLCPGFWELWPRVLRTCARGSERLIQGPISSCLSGGCFGSSVSLRLYYVSC